MTGCHSAHPPPRGGFAALGLALLISSAAHAALVSPARADRPLAARVTQVTANAVYLNRGAAHSLQVGQTVELSGAGGKIRQFLQVEAVSQKWARLGAPSLDSLFPAGAKVHLRIAGRAPSAAPAAGPSAAPSKSAPLRTGRPEPPLNAAQAAALWRGVERARQDLVPPSPRGRQRPLPLQPQPVRGVVSVDYLAQLNLGSEEPRDYQELQLTSVLQVPRLFTGGLDYAHRLRASLHLARDLDARPFSSSRPVVRVDELRLGATFGPFYAQVGRLFGAPLSAATVVDGVAVRVNVRPWLTIGGFGGQKPRADDSRPTDLGSSFGSYASFRLEGHGGQHVLCADLGLTGTLWRGAWDRRTVSARLAWDSPRINSTAEASVDFFLADHPSRADGPALTLLVLSLDTRPNTWLETGVGFDRYQMIPTRELLELFGADFVLDDPVNSMHGYADLRISHRLTVGALGGFDRMNPDSWAAWGELSLKARSLWDALDLGGSASVHDGNRLFGIGGRLFARLNLSSGLHLSSSYGLFRDTYSVAQGRAILRHQAALGADLLLLAHWFVRLEGVALLSEEERLLQVLASVGYHF